MATEIKHIEAPTHWEALDDYGSHRPALWLALENTGRTPVTEFGCGYGSTPLLSKYCQRWNRFFFSYETSFEWANNFAGVTKVKDYMQVHLSTGEWKQGVIFIDNAPGEMRKDLIAKHAWNGEVLVVHDTEPGADYVYKMAEVLDTFKSRLNYQPLGMPHTTIVSNYVDLSKWKLINTT